MVSLMDNELRRQYDSSLADMVESLSKLSVEQIAATTRLLAADAYATGMAAKLMPCKQTQEASAIKNLAVIGMLTVLDALDRRNADG